MVVWHGFICCDTPLLIFITVFYSGMCSAVWCVSHYVPFAVDHLLISLHLTSVRGISKFQDISLKSVKPISMLQPMLDQLHCTWRVGKFGTFIKQCLYILYCLLIIKISVVCVRANRAQAHLFPSITLKTRSLVLLCS